MAENVAMGGSPSVMSNAAPQESATSGSRSAEQLVPQSEVNEIVRSRVNHAYEKGINEGVRDYKLKLDEERIRGQSLHQHTDANTSSVKPQDIKQMVTEALSSVVNEHTQTQQVQSVVNTLNTRIAEGEEKYPGLQKRFQELNFGATPETAMVATLATKFDNTAGIVDAFDKDPQKYAYVMQLAKVNQNLAMRAMKEISDSLSAKDSALARSVPGAPLSQLKVSPLNTGSSEIDANGHYSLEWCKKQRWAHDGH